MTITVHHIVSLQSGEQAQQIVGLLTQLLTGQGTIMATLDDLRAAMASEDTKVQGLITAFKDLAAKLAAAVAANDPVALQALVDEANATSAAIDTANPPAVVAPVAVANP